MVQSFLPACMRIRHYVLDWLSSTEGSGRKLPSSREIAARFNVSQPTVVKALQELIREGFLINLPRVGIFSNPDRVGSRKKLWGIVLGDGRWSYLTGEAVMVIFRMTENLMRRDSRYRLKVITMGETMDEEEGWPELSMLSGIFWWIPEDEMLPAIGKLAKTVPVVVVGKQCDEVPCFCRDYSEENYRIASRMLADGCRRLVLVKPDMEVEAAIAGVERACREANADFPEGCVLGSDSASLRDLERMVGLGMTPDGIIFNVPPQEYIPMLNENPAFADAVFYCDAAHITGEWKFRGYTGGVDYEEIAPLLADCLEHPHDKKCTKQIVPFHLKHV